jgi:hypothetical protein
MSDSTELAQASNPGSDPVRQAAAHSWLEAVNSFLEWAFLQADVDTGC